MLQILLLKQQLEFPIIAPADETDPIHVITQKILVIYKAENENVVCDSAFHKRKYFVAFKD